jgi:hypothetical protein
MNTTENNKLIAEFMGELVVPSQGIYLIPNTMNLIHNDELTHLQFVVNDLKYHKSWDWLMPVVEEIDHLEYESERLDKIDRAIKSRHVGNTCNAVVEFSKWYNKNK